MTSLIALEVSTCTLTTSTIPLSGATGVLDIARVAGNGSGPPLSRDSIFVVSSVAVLSSIELEVSTCAMKTSTVPLPEATSVLEAARIVLNGSGVKLFEGSSSVFASVKLFSSIELQVSPCALKTSTVPLSGATDVQDAARDVVNGSISGLSSEVLPSSIELEVSACVLKASTVTLPGATGVLDIARVVVNGSISGLSSETLLSSIGLEVSACVLEISVAGLESSSLKMGSHVLILVASMVELNISSSDLEVSKEELVASTCTSSEDVSLFSLRTLDPSMF